MKASNRNTPSMHHPQRQNGSTSMVVLKNGHIPKNLTQNGEPQIYSWGTQKKKKENDDDNDQSDRNTYQDKEGNADY